MIVPSAEVILQACRQVAEEQPITASESDAISDQIDARCKALAEDEPEAVKQFKDALSYLYWQEVNQG
jgi:hypothetical protein